MSLPAEISWITFFVASALLFASGVLKLRHPGSVEPLLAILRIPTVLRRGRLVGLAEAWLGATAVITAWRPLIIAEAATFAFFAILIGYVLVARIPLASCGCAGARQTPPSLIHVGVDLAAAGAAASAALTHPGSLAAMWPRLEWFGIPTAVGVTAAVGLLFAVLGPLADLLQACTRIRAAGLIYQPPQGSELLS